MKTIVIAILTVISISSFADIRFNRTENSPFSLGKTVDANVPTITKEACLEYETIFWNSVDAGVVNMQFNSDVVKNSRDYYKSLRRDTKISAKVKFGLTSGSIDASKKFDGKYMNYNDSVSYVVSANYDFGSKVIKSYKLKDKYQRMIDEGSHLEVIKRCGTHFVHSSQQGIQANVLMSVTNLSQTEKKDVIWALKSGLTYSKVGEGNFEHQVEKKIKEVITNSTFKVSAQAFGGSAESFNGFAQASSGDMPTIMNAMQEFMKSASKETSIPMSYNLVSLEMFGLEIPEYNEDQEKFFELAYFLTIDYEMLHARVTSEMTELRNLNHQIVKEKMREFQGVLYRLSREISKVQHRVNKCHLENKCNPRALRKISLDMNWVSNMLAESSLEATCYDSGNGEHFVNVSVFGRLNNSDLIKEISFKRILKNGTEVDLFDGANIHYGNDLEEGEYSPVLYGSLEGVFPEEALSPIRLVKESKYIMTITNIFDVERNYMLQKPIYKQCNGL
jgi:hypothetical protein